MSYKKSVDTYYQDLTNLLKMLDIYIINYRNLVSTLNDINLNVLISKRKKRKAIKQVEELGNIIDTLLIAIQESQKSYLRYVNIKNDVLSEIITVDFVRLEIEQEILSGVDENFKNEFITLCPSDFKNLSKSKSRDNCKK